MYSDDTPVGRILGRRELLALLGAVGEGAIARSAVATRPPGDGYAAVLELGMQLG